MADTCLKLQDHATDHATPDCPHASKAPDGTDPHKRSVILPKREFCARRTILHSRRNRDNVNLYLEGCLTMSEDHDIVGDGAVDLPERRDFLAKAGRFAVVTPAAVTVLLSTSMDAQAGRIFKSPGQPKHMHKHKYKKIHKKIHKHRRGKGHYGET